MDHDQQLRNLRDFLLVYNRMTEICFQRCSSNFNYRNLTMDEEQCVDSCAGKLIRSNHRLMSTYVQLMPRMVQRRMEEMESKAAENAKAAEAAATSGAVDTATLNASPAFETPITSLTPPQLPPSVTEVAPEIHDSVLKSAGLAIPPDTTATEVKLSAATPLTPKTEGLNIPVLNEAGPLHTAGFPGLPESGVQADFGGPKPASSPENVLRAATSASISEGMAGQDRPSEVPPPSSQ